MDLAAQQLRFNTEPLGQPLAHQPHRQQHRLGHTQGLAHLVVILLRDGGNIPDRDAVGVGENITLPGLPLLRGGDHGRHVGLAQKDPFRVVDIAGDVLKGEGFDNGAWVAPTVFTDCTDEMTIVREEIFGPVMSILTYESEEEAIRRANDTDYGLAAGIVTADLNRAHGAIHQLEAGICWINTWGESAAEMPVGGYKHSGIGRENGVMTLQSYTQVKSIQVEMGKFQSIF